MRNIDLNHARIPKINAVTTVTTDEHMRLKRQAWRKLMNSIALTLSLVAMAFGLFWLIWILYTTITLGLNGLSWRFLLK